MKVVIKNFETDVPPETIGQIQAFKNGLDEAYKEYFLCQPPETPNPAALEKALYQKLGLPEPNPAASDASAKDADLGPWLGLYLTEVEIKVQVVPDARRLVAIKTIFEIPYGQDAALDVFAAGKDGKWGQVIHFTSRPYASIVGAFTGFDYRLSPPDEKGKWFAVATYINPWPSSCWQTLSVEALRPDFYLTEPEDKDSVPFGEGYSIFHDEEYGYVCDDVPPYLAGIGKDGFEIRFSISSIDEGSLNSVSHMNYRIDGDEVTRVQPVATNAVNFADEWVRRKWEQALLWSAQGNLAALARSHAALHKTISGDFISLRSCSASAEEEVGFSASGEGGKDGPTWYFLVNDTRKAYTMLRVSHQPKPECKGRNRLDAVKER